MEWSGLSELFSIELIPVVTCLSARDSFASYKKPFPLCQANRIACTESLTSL